MVNSWPKAKKVEYDEILLDSPDAIYLRVGDTLHKYHSGQIVQDDRKNKVIRVLKEKLELETPRNIRQDFPIIGLRARCSEEPLEALVRDLEAIRKKKEKET